MKNIHPSTMTFSEYADFTEREPWKWEYHAGTVVEMPPLGIDHHRISTDVMTAFSRGLEKVKSTECFGSRLPIYVAVLDKVLYPDGSIFSETPILHQNFGVKNPRVLLEVLSSGTEAYDRGDKFTFYRCLPSLKTYVLIDSTKRSVQTFTRTPEYWALRAYDETHPAFCLDVLGLKISMDDIYARVDF